MLKGKVTIDLHNHNSGFTERIEKENMITNAPARIVRNLSVKMNAGAEIRKILDPLATTLFGGLMMFDISLKEDKNNVIPPLPHLTGYGLQEMNTSSIYQGSINELESQYIDRGYTNVWEFTTSQANGIISSLALSTNTFPYEFKAITSIKDKQSLTNYSNATEHSIKNIFLPIISDNQYVYYAELYVSSNNQYYAPNQFRIKKVRMPIQYKIISIFDTIPEPVKTWEDETGYGTSLPAIYKSDDDYYDYYYSTLSPCSDGYVYIVAGDNTETGVNFYIRRYKYDDLSWDIDAEFQKTIYIDGIFVPYRKIDRISLTATSILQPWVVSEGCIFTMGLNEELVYAIDLDTHIVKQFDVCDNYENVIGLLSIKGGIGLINYDSINQMYVFKFLNSDGKILKGVSSIRKDNLGISLLSNEVEYMRELYVLSGVIRNTDSGQLLNINMSMWYSAQRALNTIANLDEPITKTSSQSMKVSYTLLDYEEE